MSGDINKMPKSSEHKAKMLKRKEKTLLDGDKPARPVTYTFHKSYLDCMEADRLDPNSSTCIMTYGGIRK